jgi:hypothetical protein
MTHNSLFRYFINGWGSLSSNLVSRLVSNIWLRSLNGYISELEILFLYRCSDPRLGRLKLGPIPLPRGGAIPHQETKTIEPGHYILYERGNDSFINSNLCSVNIMFYSRFKRSIHWLLADSRFFHLPSAEPYCITDVYSFSIEARPCKSPTSTVCLQLQLGFVGRSHSDCCAQERPGLFDHGAKSRTSRSWWQFYRA